MKEESADFIHDACLLDLGFAGSPFTWCNNRSGVARIYKRLDRILVNQSWLSLNVSTLVSHLAFADDLVIFTRGLRSSLRVLMDFLGDYEQATGQKVNKNKSLFIASSRCSSSQVRAWSTLAGMRYGSLPLQYLGGVVFAGRKRKHYFQFVLDKVEKRLAGWQKRFLSSGARLLLIRHVLAAIPIHIIAALDPPKWLFQQLELRFANFLWGELDSGPTRHWKRWSSLCYPTEENGLALRSLQDLSKAFSCKLLWKYTANQGIWANFLHSLPGGWEDSFCANRMHLVEDVFQDNVAYVVNNGSSLFWWDNWSGKAGSPYEHRAQGRSEEVI